MNNINDTDNTSEYYIYPDGYEPIDTTKKEKIETPCKKKVGAMTKVDLIIMLLMIMSLLFFFALVYEEYDDSSDVILYGMLCGLLGCGTIIENLKEATTFIIFGALWSGITIGAMPLFTVDRGHISLGVRGWYLCAAGSLLLGIYLAVPLCIVFTAIAIAVKNTDKIKKKPIGVIFITVIVMATVIILGIYFGKNCELNGILYGTYTFLDVDVVRRLFDGLQFGEPLALIATMAVGALASGAVFGIAPAVIASKHGRKKLALAGWLSCVIGSFYFGLFAAIPLCCLFATISLFKKRI